MIAAPETTYRPVDHRTLAQAQRLMRNGWDIHEAALSVGVRSRDLDKALWTYVGELAEWGASASKPRPGHSDDKFHALYMQGVDPDLIAERFGVNRGAVVEALSRKGVSLRRRAR